MVNILWIIAVGVILFSLIIIPVIEDEMIKLQKRISDLNKEKDDV